ncbi:hypothetical protein ESA94_03425 [Lacibacter luteus]|uniref:Uncharacterized protein n=1 Tax=Lacibacter luteus TaxID=2508719 RepID=A0A4Q1CMX3_9BACT|nr:hypothetical protein [Lacibacter luteus]RXK62075.1 hypothetical protein ESA94_03425 [Lacibacter luteus]
MKQYSIDNSSLQLDIYSGHLLFVDPLYFQKIADNYSTLKTQTTENKKELLKSYEEQVFPYGGGALLGYKYLTENIKTYLLDPRSLKPWDSDDDENDEIEKQAALKQITAFRLDTSVFLIIDLVNMDKLLDLINYNDLIDALFDKKLDIYFEKINQQLGNKGWGLCKLDDEASIIVP